MYQKLLAFLLFVISLPLLLLLFILVTFTSKGPFIFKQKRTGKNGKIFTLYKIRTMVENAEALKGQYRSLNEADGPVFKIKNDPRYTRVGKYISQTGLDELPQLINVIKGEMALVGPRPLPVDEALKVPSKYKGRFTVLPGITSLWVIRGAHKLNFAEWMELDLEYIRKSTIWHDVEILFSTIKLIFSVFFSKLFKTDEKK